MAGICGFVSFEGEPGDRSRLQAMLVALKARGAGEEQALLRGQAALGAIARSSRSDQPNQAAGSSRSGKVWAVLEGFFANSAELRGEINLRNGRDQSQAGLLAELYERFGQGVAGRLEGMYAAVIWDERERHLFLLKDRFGAKPLYYTQTPHGFAFASSIAALAAYGVPRDLDLQSVDDYLTLGYVPAPGSIYQGIQKLPHAHTLRVNRAGSLQSRRYWDVAGQAVSGPAAAIEEDAAAEKVWSILCASVRRFSPQRGDIGTFLSGGPDSAAIVAALADLKLSPRTFTAGFQDPSFDESALARITAGHHGTRHEELLLDQEDAPALAQAVAAFDEPYAHPSAVPIYLISRLAAKHVSVCLGGDGADGLFGGASTYAAAALMQRYRTLPSFLGHGLVPWAVRKLPVSHSRAGFEYLAKRFVSAVPLDYRQAHLKWMEVISREQKKQIYGPCLAERRDALSPFRFYAKHFRRASHLPLLNQLMYVDTNLFLPGDILVKVDRLGSAHGLDVRTPYLDHRLAQYALSLPPEFKLRQRQRKYLLRKALAGRIPPPVLRQKKIGFISPASQWLCGGLKELMGETLKSRPLREAGLLNPDVVRSMIDSHLAMRLDHGRALWSLLALTLWLQKERKREEPPAAGS